MFTLVLAVPFTVGYFNRAVGLIVNENEQYATEKSKNEINQMASSIAKAGRNVSFEPSGIEEGRFGG